MPIRTFIIGGAIVTAFGVSMLSAMAYQGSSMAKFSKISISAARRIAHKAVHGKIFGQELEREIGGSGLRYSFDIKDGKTMREVGVDANTGAILENIVEGKHPD
jgi:uncharacterized membrane protein YkoI